MKGTVVIDEIVFPITDLRLHAGVLQVIASVRGPLAAGGGELTEVRVFGDDGMTVIEARRTRASWPLLPDASFEMDMTVPIQMLEEA
jgi:hypothetical protein